MDEITNADQLEAWLKNRPREDAVLIAARCALRAFPLLAPVIGSNAEEHRATIILPICRAIAVASVTGAWTTQPMEVSRAAGEAAEAAYAVADALAGVTADVDYAAIAADSAYAAAGAVEAYAADNSAVVFAAESAARASAAARYAYSPHLNFFWRMAQDDAIGLERGSSRGRLTEKPLWHAHTPTGIFEPWHELRDHLLAANEGWEVWTEWYQDRLDGKPAIEELEVAKALIANETWDAGPATLNAEIARLIGERPSPAKTSEIQQPPADLSSKAAGHQSIVSARLAISAQTADLHDRVAQEIVQQRERRSNDPVAVENVEFLEGLQTELSNLNDAVNALPEDPQPVDIEPATDVAWNLRDKIEEYAGWIAGEEHARQIANGTLLGGMVTLMISFGWSPLPLTAAAVAMIGGHRLKAHLADLIKQMKSD